MRPFEMASLLCLVAAISTLTMRAASLRVRRALIAVTLGLMGLGAWAEGTRWQLVPAYVIAAVGVVLVCLPPSTQPRAPHRVYHAVTRKRPGHEPVPASRKASPVHALMPRVWDSHCHQCCIQNLAHQGEPIASSPDPMDIPFLSGLEETQVHNLAIGEILSQVVFKPGFDLAWGKVEIRDGNPVNELGLT